MPVNAGNLMQVPVVHVDSSQIKSPSAFDPRLVGCGDSLLQVTHLSRGHLCPGSPKRNMAAALYSQLAGS